MAVPRLRDKVIRTLTLRQTWPRNMGSAIGKPRWMGLPARAPFPPNVLYQRPRSIDRTPPDGGGVPPQEGLITQEPALTHGGVSKEAANASFGSALALVASAPVANVVTFTWEGGEAPFSLDPGDGSGVQSGVVSGVTHDYTAAGSGTYTAMLTSGSPPLTASADVTITVALADDPWDSMFTHAAIDAWVEENSIEQPVGWSSMTIAQKKEWLDNNA